MRFFANVILVAMALVSTHASVAAAEPQEGKDYTVIPSAAAVDKASKILVTEFFSYQCPHCFAFSQPLRDWAVKLPADVQFERKAVSIGHKPWIDIARSFYALKALGKLESLDADIFNAIHQRGVRLDDISYIMGWLTQRKVAVIEFDAAYRSPVVRDEFERGEQLGREYKIPSIPTMVIDGTYLVAIETDKPFDQQLAVVNHLIARARKDRAK